MRVFSACILKKFVSPSFTLGNNYLKLQEDFQVQRGEKSIQFLLKPYAVLYIKTDITVTYSSPSPENAELIYILDEVTVF